MKREGMMGNDNDTQDINAGQKARDRNTELGFRLIDDILNRRPLPQPDERG